MRKGARKAGPYRENSLNRMDWMTEWQGHQDSNPGPTVLETVALPAELYPYTYGYRGFTRLKDRFPVLFLKSNYLLILYI